MDGNTLYKDIQSRAYSAYNMYKNIAKDACPEKWYDSNFKFKIEPNSEINGKSWCEQTTDYVEINQGVIDIYYKYFTEVMQLRKNEFLSAILLDKDEAEINDMSFEAIVYRNNKIEIIDSKSNDNSMTQLLVIFVSRFILMHELGHLFNGHCKYLAQFNKNEFNYIPMYYDGNYDLNNKISALDVRTMEMDADAFATTQAFMHISSLYNNFSTEVQIQNMQPMDLYFWWAFAIRSHYILCEDRFADNHYYPTMKYLPSCARWSLVWGSVDAILESNPSYNRFNKKRVYNELLNGALCAESMFNQLKYTSYNWVNQINGNDLFIQYADEVKTHWKSLREHLDPYSRLYLYKND